jgi:hypothetical protein
MGQWLVADLSVMDVHFQLWMVLVTVILLVWFAFVWPHATFAEVGLYSNSHIFGGLPDASGTLPYRLEFPS